MADDEVLIANLSVQVSELTSTEVIQLYTGRLATWSDGTKVTVVLLPREHPVSRAFTIDHLQMPPYQFYDMIGINSATRKINNLIRVTSEEEMIKVVTRPDGAIGYSSVALYVNHKKEIRQIRVIP